jgi:hypothetical protein
MQLLFILCIRKMEDSVVAKHILNSSFSLIVVTDEPLGT